MNTTPYHARADGPSNAVINPGHTYRSPYAPASSPACVNVGSEERKTPGPSTWATRQDQRTNGLYTAADTPALSSGRSSGASTPVVQTPSEEGVNHDEANPRPMVTFGTGVTRSSLKVDLGAAARKAAAPYSLERGARSRRSNPTVWVRPVPTSSLSPVPLETANVPCIELGDDLAEFDTIFPDCVPPNGWTCPSPLPVDTAVFDAIRVPRTATLADFGTDSFNTIMDDEKELIERIPVDFSCPHPGCDFVGPQKELWKHGLHEHSAGAEGDGKVQCFWPNCTSRERMTRNSLIRHLRTSHLYTNVQHCPYCHHTARAFDKRWKAHGAHCAARERFMSREWDCVFESLLCGWCATRVAADPRLARPS